jgi:hypothetical protein
LQRDETFEEGLRALAGRAEELEAETEFVPTELRADPLADPLGDSYPTIQALELRVRAAQERVYEWQYYLNLLRRHADENGVLPAHFQLLIDDVFSDYGGGRRT